MTAAVGEAYPPPQRAVELGHVPTWDPHPQTTRTSRWTCDCGRSVMEDGRGTVYGAAARDLCPLREVRS